MSMFCKSCGQAIKIPKRSLDSGYAKVLINVMEKNSISPQALYSLMGVSRRTFYRWLRNETNPKKINLDILRLKGFLR